jgi:hypothetical protein
MKLSLKPAMEFFSTYMYQPLQGKKLVYESRNVRLGSAVTPSDWEVFASLLVDKRGHGGVSGVDLNGYEVKSAANDGSYEYQYHKETGKAKLRGDMKVGHLFFNHLNFLNRVELRYLHGSDARPYFSQWLKNYPNPYPQRYRNSLPFGWVDENAELLLIIQSGEVVFVA